MNNTKTPVMILQELMVKRNTTPHYEFMQNSGTSHDPDFHYIVFAGPVSATGQGRSKKDAKHEAALNALEKLEQIGWYVPEGKSRKPNQSSRYSHDSTCSPVRLLVNHVGALKDLCAEKKLPEPQATLISDIGPPHAREFTVQYVVGSIKYSATGPTKKVAKQEAAKKILQCLMDTLSDAGNVDIVSLEEFEKLDAEMMEKVTQIKNKNPDKSRIISTFYNSFQISDQDLLLSVMSELQSFDDPETTLNKVINLLDCEKQIDTLVHNDKNMFLIILTILCDPLLAFYGSGKSVEEATTQAHIEALNTLKFLIS